MSDIDEALEALELIWGEINRTPHAPDSPPWETLVDAHKEIRQALERQRVPEGVSDLYSVEWFKRGNEQFEATIWPDPDNPQGGLGDTPMDAIRDALAAPTPEDSNE